MSEKDGTVEEQEPGFDRSDFCTIHTGNDVTTFCEKHDVVCCQVCIDMFHRNCQLAELKQAAKGVRQSAALKRTSFSLKVVSQTLTDVKQKTHDSLSKIEQGRQDALIQINQVKENIIKRLDALEAATCAELESRCYVQKQVGNAQLKAVSDVINEIEMKLIQFENPDSSISEARLFHSLKQSKGVQEKALRLAQQKKPRELNVAIQFHPDNGIEQYIAGLEFLGDFKKDTNTKSSPGLSSKVGASLQGLYLLKDKKDGKQYGSFSSCMLNDGSFIVADESNAALKRFNTSYKLIQSLLVPDSPKCLCKVSDSEVIYGSKKNVYSVFVRDQMKLDRKVAILESICRSMTFDDGLFYVAHGGGDYQRYLGVYDLQWKTQRKMGRDRLESPVGVVVNKSHDRIYVADLYNGLLTFNKNGDCLEIYNERYVINPISLCELANNVLLLAGEGSNNVLVIKEGKMKVSELLKAEDGIQKPTCLLFDEKRARLIVLMMKTDHFRVFDLK